MGSRFWVVFGACLTQFTIIGIFVSSGLFFKIFEVEFGWSRTVLSSASALGVLMMGVLAMVSGRLSDRYGPRRVLAFNGVAFGLGYILLSQMTAEWQLFVIFGVFLGLGFGSHDVVTLSTVARWFEARRGMMTAVVKVGTAVGQVAVPPIVAIMIAGMGWRPAVLTLGIIATGLLLIAAMSMKAPPVRTGATPTAAATGVEFVEAQRTRIFWTLCAVQFLFFPTMMTLPLHLPAHGMDLGMTPTLAAGLISVMGASSIAGRLVIGRLLDMIGGRNCYLVSLACLIAALGPISFLTAHLPLFAMVAVYGFAHGALFVVVSPTVAEYFGMRAHGAIFGVVVFFGTIGGSIGPILAGVLFDMTGTYTIAFLTLMAMAALAFILILTLPRPRREAA
ncbi:MFS transporter [Phaeobacter marinintestinus]|uniref:MFS transporter n=1 Tax=Falsiphaeobacter marinintestinus TaxID=1492905 RepID=UPI0011B40D4D|nr:MFS transporter [Phaeobacter marinintestinus]